MSKSTHTPGPWKWFPSLFGGDHRCVKLESWAGGVRTDIVTVQADTDDMLIGHASPDGLLIAAAPDVLEALEAVEWSFEVEGAEELCPHCRKHRLDGHLSECIVGKAVAKARGGEA